MCGRIALHLCSADILNACAFKKRGESTFSKPIWSPQSNLGKRYSPSYNIAPTEVTPVLMTDPESLYDEMDIVVKPMMWKLIPPSHEGSYKEFSFETNNCRIEGLLNSPLYKPCFTKGRRCVILAEGFYEWQKIPNNPKSKQPYFIFSAGNDPSKMHSSDSGTFDEVNGWNGVRLLKMAGLYSVWESPEGTLYSYTVITMPSNKTMDHIHERMPAILETDEQIEKWIDLNISPEEAFKVLTPVKDLSMYPVDVKVNRSVYKEPDCVKPIDVKQVQSKKNVGSKNLMSNWLKRASTSSNESQDVKLIKR